MKLSVHWRFRVNGTTDGQSRRSSGTEAYAANAQLASVIIATPPPTSAVPYAVALWDPQHGLLGTGACARAVDEACGRGTIQLTSNGGRNFRVVLRTRRPVVGLQTAGPRGAIATTKGGGSFR